MAAVGAGIALFAVLWFSVFSAESSVSSDDGAYALHVRALNDRDSWSVPHVLAEADPAGLTYPYQNSAISDQGFFPAARHPVWVAVLRAGADVGDVVGMRVPPLLGLLVAVGGAASMAGIVHGRDARWVGALVAAGSPLLFHALQLWAHAAVAGAIAVAMAGALTLLRDEVSPWWLAATVGGVATAAALRADGFIFAVAVAGVIGLVGLLRRRLTLVGAGAVVGLASAFSFALVARYGGSIVGPGSDSGISSSRASGVAGGRVRGIVHTFLSTADSVESLVLLVVAFVVAGYAVLQLRRGKDREAQVLFLVAAGAWVVRIALYPREMASGLLGAWPIVLLAFARPRPSIDRSEWHLLGMVLVGSLGVAVTQYDEGGGLNWGGRFLAPAIPALAVLITGGLLALARSSAGRAVLPSVVVLAAVSVVGSLVFDASVRERNHDAVQRVADVRTPVITSSVPLPRLAWSTYPEVQWLQVPFDGQDEKRGARVLLRLLRETEIESVVLFGVSPEATAVLQPGLDIQPGSGPFEVQIGPSR